MNKKFCDCCGEVIDTSVGYFVLKKEYTERDYGLPLSFKALDLCSQRCLIEFAKSKKCELKKIE